jgi:hypothetical protein
MHNLVPSVMERVTLQLYICSLRHHKFSEAINLLRPPCVHITTFFMWLHTLQYKVLRSSECDGKLGLLPRLQNWSFKYQMVFLLNCRCAPSCSRYTCSCALRETLSQTELISFCINTSMDVACMHYNSIIRSSDIVENKTNVHITFLTQNCLRDNPLNAWHKITVHTVY